MRSGRGCVSMSVRASVWRSLGVGVNVGMGGSRRKSLAAAVCCCRQVQRHSCIVLVAVKRAYDVEMRVPQQEVLGQLPVAAHL